MGFICSMENNSISFGSSIRFVNRDVYKLLEKKNFIDYRHDRPNILKADTFFSEEIRTCTGGGLVNPGSEALGFHFWDDMPNKKKFPYLMNCLFRFVKQPQNGLLVGSKNVPGNPYSIDQFQNIKKKFLERVKNLSIFEEHKMLNSETNYHYSLKDDTWTLCANFQDEKDMYYKSVTNIERLRNMYKNISIADGDRLFIDGKEIFPSDVPEIFQSAIK